jgi:ribonuclease BN (tRNA processing enzyme)
MSASGIVAMFSLGDDGDFHHGSSGRKGPVAHMPKPNQKRTRGTPAPMTQIVMLGTGSPRPDPERSGPATAIVVEGTPYLVDFGPGVIRRAAAAYQKGIVGFGRGATNLSTIFLTHLHADHTAGYPDLLLTPWIMGRRKSLDIYGPKGLDAMTKNVLRAWDADISSRMNGIDKLPASGCRVSAHEIEPGTIYTDRHIRVTAFPARHGNIKDAFGFRFETADRIIVISGDTAPTSAIAEHCSDCNVLIHEAYSQGTYEKVSRKWQRYRRKYHTSSKELAALATRVKPNLLVLYHRSNAGGGAEEETALLQEIRQLYRGRVVTGRDLDIF